MNALRLTTAFILLAFVASAANAQKPMRIRGDITQVAPGMIMVKSREGKDLHINLAPEVNVSVATAIKFEDIKPGDYMGVTARKSNDGRLVAVEVHSLPPQVPEGHMAWDLAPDTTMTNARIASAVAATGNREITMKYKDGEQKIVVPDGIPLVRSIPGSVADLKPGEYIFTVAMVGADGSITARGVNVSKNGVKPPQ